MNEARIDEQTTNQAGLFVNSRWNLVAFAFALAPNFITVPLVVRLIGITAFGRAGLVLAVCAPLVLVGTVLGQAVVREVSSRLATGDGEGSRRTVDAALRLCLAAGTIGWLLLVATGPRITSDVMSEGTPYSVQNLAFLIAATGWFFQQFSLVFQAISAARQDYRTLAGVAALSGAATIVSTLGLTSIAPAAEGYLGGVAAGFALSAIAWWLVLRRDIRWRGILRANRNAELRSLLRFARWQGLSLLAGAFSNQIDRYTLGSVAPVSVIGQYNVANRLQEAAYIGAVRSGEVLFPRFGSLSGRSGEERSELFQRGSWLVGTFSVMVLAPLIPLSDALISLWVPQAGLGAAVLLRTLVLGGVVGCGSNVITYYAMGIGRNAPVALITVSYSVITIVFTVILIHAFGPLAAGSGLLLASAVRVVAGLVWTKRDFFPFLSWAELSISTLVPLIAGSLVAIATYLVGIGEIDSWVHLVAIYVALSASVLVVTVIMTSLNANGRLLVSALIESVRSRKLS